MTRWLALFALILCVLGCGGGGSGSPQPVKNATFQISWPERSRDVYSSPLTSALSVAVTFPKAGTAGSDVTINIDRDATKISGYTGTYTVNQGIFKKNLSLMTASFYAQPGEAGDMVGTASASVSLTGTNINITPIELVGKVKSVVVNQPSPTLTTASGATQLSFMALDASGTSVAVTPGSAIWSVISGSGLSLTKDGIATPVSATTTSVTATVDGIASPQTSVSVILPNITGATFQIVWPARSRALTNPLTSALSVAVAFKQASATGNDAVMNIDRDPTQVGGYTGTYTISQPINPNILSTLTATFYAGADEGGAVVGTATASATASGSNVNIGSVVLTGVIKNVAVIPVTLTVGGGATQLAFSAKDGSGNVVAVTPGSAFWKVASGGAFLTLTQDGIATPIAAGAAKVTATVDGVASPQTAVSIILPNITGATFQIVWPARSRALTNPLTSALSVAVAFKQASATGSDAVMNIDRDATQIGGYTGTYTISQAINPNVLSTLTATFYANAGEGGAVVGTATASATASGSSVNIGSIVLDQVVKSVTVIPATLTTGGGTTQLVFSALDGSGNVVAVTPGSAFWKVASGGAFLSLTQDGIATPLTAGTAEVTATIDGVASTQQSITVKKAGPSFQTFAISATSVAYDATRNMLYASATASSPTGASQIVPINLSTGLVGTPFSAGNNPTYLAVSTDNSQLFAGSGDGVTVKRVSLANKTINGTITLPTSPSGIFSQLLAVPNQPNSFIATRINTSSSTLPGQTLIVDGSTPRANSAGLGQVVAVNDSGSRIFGVDSQVFENPVALADITNSGIANASSSSLPLGAEANLCSSGNTVVVAGFLEIDFLNATTGATLGTSQLSSGNFKAPIEVPGSSKVYILVWNLSADSKQVQTWDSVSMSMTGPSFSLQGIPGDPEGALQEGGSFVYAGPNRIAFVAPNQVVVVSGLP